MYPAACHSEAAIPLIGVAGQFIKSFRVLTIFHGDFTPAKLSPKKGCGNSFIFHFSKN